MPKYVRCTYNHPAVVSLQKLFNLMDIEEISFMRTGSHFLVSVKNEIYELMDIEDSPGCPSSSMCLPPDTEWKLVHEKKDLIP